MEDFGEGSNLK